MGSQTEESGELGTVRLESSHRGLLAATIADTLPSSARPMEVSRCVSHGEANLPRRATPPDSACPRLMSLLASPIASPVRWMLGSTNDWSYGCATSSCGYPG